MTIATDTTETDIVSKLAQDPEQEARMRAVFDHVGSPIWNLLFIARNQNLQKCVTIANQGSLEARRCRQFIFAADVLLGIAAADVSMPPSSGIGPIQKVN